ncbi:MAG: GNAT family protein [Patescibacteria group bacterium]
MPPLTFLETTRLILRPLELADLPHLVRWINKPEMRSLLSVRTPYSSAAERAWLEHMMQPGNPPSDIVFAIVHKKGPRLMGVVGLHQIDWVSRRAVVGQYLGNEKDRGKGYGKEALLSLVSYAFLSLDLFKIDGEAYETNTASKAMLVSCGFTQEGARRKAFQVDGKRIDAILFGITQDEWRAKYSGKVNKKH